MGVYKEVNLPRWAGVCLLILAFFALFQPWFLGLRELFRTETFFAVAAAEFDPAASTVTLHGMPVRGFPLYPGLVWLLYEKAGVEMELALRLVSILFAGAGAVVVFFAAASNRSYRAGLVAAAMFLSTNLMLEKGIDGHPATLNVFLLLSAQLVFFQFGVRRANWSMGWILAAMLLSLGFLSGGFRVIFLFIFPMFFFRRPLSVRSKFRKIGFPIGVTILAATLLIWFIPLWGNSVPLNTFQWMPITFGGYLLKLLWFPIELAVRLMPWTILAWIPFCVALQALDETPIFSRYLRTLTIATLGLLWILPESDPRELLYLLGPLSILLGMHYELAMRRYGHKIRRVLLLCEIFVVGVAVAIIIGCLVPDRFLRSFMSLDLTSAFSTTFLYRIAALSACAMLIMLAIFIHKGRRQQPVWLILLCTSIAGGIFFWTMLQPYRYQEKERRQFGQTVAGLLAGQPAGILYKSTILPLELYGELFYSGATVRKMSSLGDLPGDVPTVYVLSTEFPQLPERGWTNLMDNDFRYRGYPVQLWRGDLRPEEPEEPLPLSADFPL